jgi:hypothetical protein
MNRDDSKAGPAAGVCPHCGGWAPAAQPANSATLQNLPVSNVGPGRHLGVYIDAMLDRAGLGRLANTAHARSGWEDQPLHEFSELE